jgi:hypothetical protein
LFSLLYGGSLIGNSEANIRSRSFFRSKKNRRKKKGSLIGNSEANIASDQSTEDSIYLVNLAEKQSITGKLMTPNEPIWTQKDYRTQIIIFENQISLLYSISKKTLDCELKSLIDDLKNLYKNYVSGRYTDAELNIIDIKCKMYKIINTLSRTERLMYFATLWGFYPIAVAVTAMFISFLMIKLNCSDVILGIPLWASCIAVIGSSVQILIGVVNDYNDGHVITEYRRLWYFVLPFISFSFGFLTFFLVTGGLINLTSGFISNQNANLSSQYFGSFCITSAPDIIHYAIPILACFLVGFSTNWFISLLRNFTYKT